ncbi:TerD family protein [Streptomyces sp. NPDC013313]|uniref:TerD family protein n=1 Tax=Streptomyces sp. NPDC013313 TaxID=3155603 RepID=UPI0033CFD1B5
MTAELVRGQNHPLSQVRLEIRISAGSPVLAAATLGDEHGTVPGADRVAHAGAPALPGIEVSTQAAADHRLAVDLAALPETVHRVTVLLALPERPGGPLRFGAVAAPRTAVTGLDGTEIVRFALTGLDAESAVVALELYRRQGAWKVRAVGQGYDGGLAALLADQGLPSAAALASEVHEAVARSLARAVPAPPDAPGPTGPEEPRLAGARGSHDAAGAAAPGGPIDYTHPGRRRHTAPPPAAPQAAPCAASDGQPPRPVAGDAVGWSLEERLYNQIWAMFEDLARATAAYRSAVDFADSRLEKELDQALADPRVRLGAAGDAAREAAQTRHAQLVDQARAAFDRDLAQLAAESEVVEPALPPACARWDNPVWHGYRVPAAPPMALRLGDLHLPESAPLRIPLLARLPLERGLWIDSGPAPGPDDVFLDSADTRRLAMDAAVALAVRLLAVHPAGEFTVHVLDPAGSGAQALLPLIRTGAVTVPSRAGAAGVADVLGRLTGRVDLVQMALRGGAEESLPPDFDTARQLLIVNDFPHGFDDRAVNQLRYLADEGPAVGVHLLMVADREDAAAYGPLLDPLWRSLLRLTPVPDDHLADPWVGHTWTFEPSLVPPGSGILQHVLTEVTAARTKRR